MNREDKNQNGACETESSQQDARYGHRNNVLILLSSSTETMKTKRECESARALLPRGDDSVVAKDDDKHSAADVVATRKSTESDAEDDENVPARKRVRIDSKAFYNDREGQESARENREETCRSSQRKNLPRLLCIDGRINEQSILEAASNGAKRKIPRPANAFMLFANEWRKKLAADNPRESNKNISVRLGILWKNMAKDVKEKYFALARQVDAEHKRKYPDYVYNPKEARLRKAMREQNRELSRRLILQNANNRSSSISAPSVSVSVAGGFLDHRHRFGCISASSAPPMSINHASHLESQRFAEPWFENPVHRSKQNVGKFSVKSKQVLSPRVSDWYGAAEGDPIERLQAMDAMHQRASSAEKLSKEPLRSQTVGGCAAAFSTNGYPGEFIDSACERERVAGERLSAEFNDSQKWHPYHNDANPHPHPRAPHPSSQISNILHSGLQNANSHPQVHGSWNQFCPGMFQHGGAVARNAAIRGPRHAVFLRDRLPNRQCSYPEETTRLSYGLNKLEMDSAQVAYRLQQEHQMSQLLEPTMETTVDRKSKSTPSRGGSDSTTWESNSGGSALSPNSNASQSMQQHKEPLGNNNEKDREARRASDKYENKKKTSCKQPLPGFHQAFGSTEIGRFSRSEFFVNMVGENNGATMSATSETIDEEEVSRPERSAELTRASSSAVIASSTTVTSTSAAIDETARGTLSPAANENVSFDVPRNFAAKETAARSFDVSSSAARSTFGRDDAERPFEVTTTVSSSSSSSSTFRNDENAEDTFKAGDNDRTGFKVNDNVTETYGRRGNVAGTFRVNENVAKAFHSGQNESYSDSGSEHARSPLISAYCAPTTHSWHIPHVSTIGSET